MQKLNNGYYWANVDVLWDRLINFNLVMHFNNGHIRFFNPEALAVDLSKLTLDDFTLGKNLVRINNPKFN